MITRAKQLFLAVDKLYMKKISAIFTGGNEAK
jgi:hypothetical protein